MFKSLDKIIEGANSTIDKVANNLTKAATKIVNDPSVPYGVLWERSEDVQGNTNANTNTNNTKNY